MISVPKTNNYSNKSYKFALKCGENSRVIIPAGPVGTTVTAAALTINLSNYVNPCIKLDYITQIIGLGFAGTLNFQIFRTCNNQGPIPISPEFTYEVTVPQLITSDFSFFTCDCDLCLNDCCTYIVVITIGGGGFVGNVGAFSSKLIATIVDSPKPQCQ
ncbi:DUF4489 domain-containing protein [Alkalibaculum sporogenes]|uniref:DUF4489 domain-containing protein n=1 Tax=Alkalibaculum sporogenes TaxID=2655001 RepID=UPI00128D29B5|nr:DUF4489 domain-containing protein [Alkalibaculum sporogenes]